MLNSQAMTAKTPPLLPPQIQNVPFWDLFSPKQAREIFEALPRVSFKAGEVILRQGILSDCFYLIAEGGVKVRLEDSSGVVYVLGELGRGSLCGELALLNGRPSRITATALMDSTLLAFNRAALTSVIRAVEPERVLNLFIELDEQIRAASERGFREILMRRLLDSRAEAEKQRALTEMAAGLAHEVNTPLGVINTAVMIMARELASTPDEMSAQRAAEIAESLELMRLNVERANRLLKGFKKVSAGQLIEEKELFNIAEATEETISLISAHLKQKQVQVQFHNKLTEGQTQYFGYRGPLSQALINLLTNVERYAYPNGSGGLAEVTLYMGEDGKNYSLSVRDYGGGILPQNQERIFEPFFTTGKSIGGTGLGLSIVKNIVEKTLKGTIKMKSIEGMGAEFIISFPRELP